MHMQIDYHIFRRFYDELLEANRGDERSVLHTWVTTVTELLDALRPLRHRESPGVSLNGDDESTSWYREALYALYAVSRASDFLIEFGCPAGRADPALGITGGRTLNRDRLSAHEWFFDQVGLQRFARGGGFSPFHHEIFGVSADETVDTVTVENILWPGFRFGDLLFCRAGVHVRAPSHLLDAAAATTSTLYFTNRRTPRRTSDLSHGWGSNSQWRTLFHRFYEDLGGLHLNWDGEIYLDEQFVPSDNDPGDRLSLQQRQQLLLHRCFVTHPMPPEEWDQFPYDDRISLRTSTWPLDLNAMLPDSTR
jgi:hypothetical protein